MEFEMTLLIGDTLKVSEVTLHLSKFNHGVSFAIHAPPHINILRQELIQTHKFEAACLELVQ